MSAASVILEVLDGPATGRTFTFRRPDFFLMGRSDTADLCLEDDTHLSRNHLRIEIDPPRCCVVDLHSANGTYVNGERIFERWLENGDTVSGGRTLIRVRIVAEEEPGSGLSGISDAGLIGPTALMNAVPAIAGDWRLLNLIGQGTMGTVYRAVHQSTEEVAAVKLISSGSAGDQYLQLFLREVSVLRELNHKRIIRWLDSGNTGGHLYLAMEYVDAIDLMELMTTLPLTMRIRIASGLMKQVLDGLDYAHRRGFVHRDIKPKNILVARRENGLKAKLADFGLAKNFLDAGLSRFSTENDIKGTLNYMAPEQVENSRYATPRSDLFSCGASLYTMITGSPIYDLHEKSVPIDTIVRNGPVPITARVADVPQELVALLDRALAAEPTARFASASEFRDALTLFAGM